MTIENALNNADGVAKAGINFATEKVTIEYDPKILDEKGLARIVEDVGYRIPLTKVAEEEKDIKKMSSASFKMRSAWGFSSPIILFMVLHMVFGYHIPGFDWFMILLALPVVFWNGSDTLIGAMKATRNLTPNMDTLIAMGTGVAFITGPCKAGRVSDRKLQRYCSHDHGLSSDRQIYRGAGQRQGVACHKEAASAWGKVSPRHC